MRLRSAGTPCSAIAETAFEVADFTKMFGGDTAAAITGPPRGGNHEVLDGPPLHFDKHFLHEFVVEELAAPARPALSVSAPRITKLVVVLVSGEPDGGVGGPGAWSDAIGMHCAASLRGGKLTGTTPVCLSSWYLRQPARVRYGSSRRSEICAPVPPTGIAAAINSGRHAGLT